MREYQVLHDSSYVATLDYEESSLTTGILIRFGLPV